MRIGVVAVCLPVLVALSVGCATSRERRGQSLFAGCVGEVDDEATQRTGLFVCKGERDPAPFGGNGRACGDCHVPGDDFGISTERIATLPGDHPFFYPGLDEDQELLRSYGLVHVVVRGEIDEFRPTPKLVHLDAICDGYGNCDALGLRGDRVRNLCVFSSESIRNHMARSPERVPDEDFRLPDREECDALVAYLLSDLVSKQDERNR